MDPLKEKKRIRNSPTLVMIRVDIVSAIRLRVYKNASWQAIGAMNGSKPPAHNSLNKALIHNKPVTEGVAAQIARALKIDCPEWIIDHAHRLFSDVSEYLEKPFPIEKDAEKAHNPEEAQKYKELRQKPTSKPSAEQKPPKPNTQKKRKRFPKKQEMDEHGSKLVGIWYGYHMTRNEDDKIIIEKSIVEISPKGGCTCKHIESRSKDRYSGALRFERDGDYVVLKMKRSLEGAMSARLHFRLSPPSSDATPSEISGYWSGLDQDNDPCASPIILNRSRLSSDQDEELRLAAKKLKNCKKYLINPEDYQPKQEEFHKKWNSKLIFDAIRESEDDESIRIMCLRISDNFEALKDTLQERLIKRYKAKDTSNTQKMKIRILMFDDDEVMVLRSKYRIYANEFLYKQSFSEQFAFFQSLKETFKDVATIKVLRFRSWPSYYYFKFGQRKIIWTSYPARTSPINHAMRISKNPESDMWQLLEKEFYETYSLAYAEKKKEKRSF